MLKKLLEVIKLQTGLEICMNSPKDNDNCIVVRYSETGVTTIKARARADIFVIHEDEKQALAISQKIHLALLNKGDKNPIFNILNCNLERVDTVLYQSKTHIISNFTIDYRK